MSETIDNIQNSAIDGNPQAQYELGQMYEFGRGVGQDYTEAMAWYMKAAQQNYAQAQYAIGLLYEQGRGVVENPATAATWYKKAADQGDTWAINNLAMLYSYGKGVETNDDKANELYMQAANLGHFQAQYNLAARYASGRGLEVDLISAYFWFERSKLGASALNQERANKMIEAVSAHMSPEDIKQAKERVAQIFKQID